MGLTLHGRALHRHGARVAHAGLAVADPPLSKLQQTRAGPRGSGPASARPVGPRPQPHLGAAPGRGRVHTRAPPPADTAACRHLRPPTRPPADTSARRHPRPPTPPPADTPACQHPRPLRPLPAQAEGPPSRAAQAEGPPSLRWSKVEPAGARATHKFGEPIRSHAGWKRRRRGVTGGTGVQSHRPPGQALRGLATPPPPSSPWEQKPPPPPTGTGQTGGAGLRPPPLWRGTGPAQAPDRDAPSRGRARARARRCAYGTWARRRPCGR